MHRHLLLIRYVNNTIENYVKHAKIPINCSYLTKSLIDYACQPVTCYELR